MRKLLLLCMLASATLLHAQNDGIWQGYDGEWSHVANQLLALAQATPPDKFAWRPAPSVRSMSEVYMHIVDANFYLLSATGEHEPEITPAIEKSATGKPEVIAWLQRSLDAVKTARAHETPADLKRKVKIQGKVVKVDGIYLRILIHDNEHMGQLVAYARMNGIVPPWSKP